MRKSREKPVEPSRLIDERIAELGDWRGRTLARIRALVREADPEVVEEWKWRGVPVWSHDGIVCTGETYKGSVKVTFAKGASLEDPEGLFNASLDGNVRRAIDVREGETIDEDAFKALVRAAVALNASSARRAPGKARPKAAAGPSRDVEERPAAARPKGAAAKPRLLAGGNPQVAKGEGDAPVQAYVEAMPGWKRDVGRRLDALVAKHVPHARKAVKWNSPFYGVEGKGWFLSFHTFTGYVKVTFFQGASLRPVPPGGTAKSKDARWIDVREGELDETQMAAWVKQAAALPGWLTADIRGK